MTSIWRWLTACFRPTAPPATSSVTTNYGTPRGICERVIGCALTVSDIVGSGLPEIIYENALAHELRKAGLSVCQQRAIAVYYDGMIVGDYTADLLVENTILVDLKPVEVPDAVHTTQCMNYLKATGLALCLTFSFANPRLDIKRVVKGA
jgi:GxxExxY protein